MNHVNVNELTCGQALALVAEYIDKELVLKERLQVERHIEICRHCYDRIEFERLLKYRLATLRAGGISASLREKVDAVLESF